MGAIKSVHTFKVFWYNVPIMIAWGGMVPLYAVWHACC